MNADDAGHDPVLAAIAALRARDVSRQRADRLRHRCHERLQEPRRRVGSTPAGRSWLQLVAPVLVSAWCVVYLLEVLHRAAVIYGF